MSARATAFVEFVLRHTMPERAKAHGHDVVHSIILFHPFVQENAPTAFDDFVKGSTTFSYMDAEGPTWTQRERIKADADEATKLLLEAAQKFRFYQSQHEAKAKVQKASGEAYAQHEEKARVNAEIASRIEAFVGR